MRRKAKMGLNPARQKDIAALAAMKDDDIDLTDMPEVLDWSGAEIGRFYMKKNKVKRRRRNGQARVRHKES